MSDASPGPEAQLPRLREDLRLIEGGSSASGEGMWLVYDPMQHRYVQIDRRSADLLSLWRDAGSARQLAEKFQEVCGSPVTAEEIEGLVRFAETAGLVVAPREGGWRALWEQQERGRNGVLASALHNYLFFRIPLLRPEPFLRAAAPYVAFLYTRWAAGTIAALGMAGLYLALRQWSHFVEEVMAFLSLEGALAFVAGLGVVKSLHELGHGFTAVRYGCKVSSMGIAFVLMAPLLYTDVTDVWRLKSRRKRLAVGAAGLAVELALACVATLAWALLPPGALRSTAFVVATTGWVLSLVINLNPFMRFDGYYMLSDALGIENLQERSMAFGRWRLREMLFGLGDPPPEALPLPRLRLMWLYAWGTWIYRVILFTGIALVVYNYFFKVLGLVLFAVEIIYFVIWPVWSELRTWSRLKDRILKKRRAWFTAALVATALVALVVPWSARVEVPAMLEAEGLQRLYPARAGRLAAVHVKPGDRVAAGAPIIEMVSDEINQELVLNEARMKLINTRLDRRVADALDRDATRILEHELIRLEVARAGLIRARDELSVRTPRAGVVLEMDPTLRPGRSISSKDLVAVIGMGTSDEAFGYVSEGDIWRLTPGVVGRFVPDDPLEPSRPVRLAEIAVAGVGVMDKPELAQVHGGQVSAKSDAGGTLVAAEAVYFVRMTAGQRGPGLPQARRGLTVLEGQRASLAGRFWRHVAGVLVRESGF